MNPLAILSLISDLYLQIESLQAKVEELERDKAKS